MSPDDLRAISPCVILDGKRVSVSHWSDGAPQWINVQLDGSMILRFTSIDEFDMLSGFLKATASKIRYEQEEQRRRWSKP